MGRNGRRRPATSWTRSRQLFDEEFPDFEPFPWGRRPLDPVLVRHILLAEPLVEEFGRCFDGVSPAQAEELASCFALAACERREPLAEVLRTHQAGA